MYALIKDNQVIRTTNEESFSHNGLSFSNVSLLTPEERKANLIYDFITLPVTPLATQKACGSTLEIGDCVVIESPLYFDKSPEELASEAKQSVLLNIAKLENEITQRRLREAVTTDAGKAWLIEKDAQIEKERLKLSV